jgi:hypothetical protein
MKKMNEHVQDMKIEIEARKEIQVEVNRHHQQNTRVDTI